MRGQKLFVRPMETDDVQTVEQFLARESPASVTPRSALLGKLVGELVAVLAMEITADSVAIHNLVVARDLRKKRIGRFMLDELQMLASKVDRDRLVMRCDAPAGFLQRVGFSAEGVRLVCR
jgi:N-acetylglutamate synthase-like GNAT family acetyltransferase